MKKWVALFLICFIASISPQTIISPQFSELKGMEDQQGNTHLFYRIYKDSTWGEYYFYQSNHIYKINLTTGNDSFFLPDYAYENETGQYFFRVNDYDFWEDNEYKYIYCGGSGDFYSYTYVKRFDNSNFLFGDWQGSVSKVNISNLNDSVIFIGSWATDITGQNPIRTSFSTDGGYTWSTISDSLQLLAIRPDNEQQLFCYNDNGYIANYNGGLYKSTNGGVNFYLVDTLKKYPSAEDDAMIFDVNANNIFRLFETMYGTFVLRASTNSGEPFSWQTKYSSDAKIFISNDESVSGTVYLSDKKNIFVSTNFGDNFTLYKTLNRKIVGIYKKPNSNKLYAATKYKIYEITPDTIKIIKSLPISEEVLNFYPLAVGNKWVFHHSTVSYDPYPNYFYRIDVKEVLGDTIAPNGKYYYLVNDETLWESSLLERVDSSDGKVYRYYEDTTLTENEYVAYDLLAEVGDTVSSYRMGFNTVMFTTMYAEATFEKWGLTKPKKVFEEFTLHPPIFSITKDIGLDSIYSYFDFGETYITLKGCIIDGVIYGDTTTVGVEHDQKPIPADFRLEQNYPNPFNPSTKIKFSIPSVIASGAKQSQLVTLKVYDILGNEIATLVNEEKPAGEYEVEFKGQNLTSGVYFYQLKTGSFVRTKKMILLK